MIATIANELIQNDTYECYIKVVNDDNNIYWVQKSVPIEDATELNKEQWLRDAIGEATTFFVDNYPENSEVIE